MTDVIRLRPHPGRIGDGESIAMMGPCPGHASVGHSASTRWSTRRGMVMLAAMSTVTMLRGVSATFEMEAPRDLCIQAIQTAIVNRTQDLFQEMYLPNGHQRPHVLYQMAEHSNFGDTFIDRGEELLLARLGLETAAECSLGKGLSMMKTCNSDREIQALLLRNATVLFQGGGNWGDVWKTAHKLRMQGVAKFAARPGMTVITMPNSLKFYHQDARERNELTVANIVEAKHPSTKLVFLFRQRDSYTVAKSMYPGVDIRLVPDMAFMIGPLVRVGFEKFKYDIMFLARVDKESEGGLAAMNAIHDEMAMRAPGLSFYVGDWKDNPTGKPLLYKHHVKESSVPALRHGLVVDAAVKYFSTAKVIVCDRLHASILALLLGIPHVVVDGGPDSTSYGKRLRTRAAAFEASEHCTPESLRYRDASTLVDGIGEAIELLDEFFGE